MSQEIQQKLRNLDVSQKDIIIDSTDGSHMHRHIRIACKTLATDDVTRAKSMILKCDDGHYTAHLTFYDKNKIKVGELTTDVSQITEMHDVSYDHYARLKTSQ